MENQVENIVNFWLTQWSEDFGPLTAQNLYKIIQRLSKHPDKGTVTVKDCEEAIQQSKSKK